MAAGAGTADEVLATLVGDGLNPQRHELARQRAQRLLSDESARRRQAESEIREHLPALPRSAKRQFNQLRVLLVIAEHKDMFGGSPSLEAKHLGKWAVLLERWPELGSALAADPARLAHLEGATSIGELAAQLGPAVPASVASRDLLAFLQSPTKLAPVAERLVYFLSHASDTLATDRPHETIGAAAVDLTAADEIDATSKPAYDLEAPAEADSGR